VENLGVYIKTSVSNMNMGGRAFTDTKYVFLNRDGQRWANGDWEELGLLLKALRVRCHLCGRRLTVENVGYVRINGAVELALCKECLRDYLEWGARYRGCLHRSSVLRTWGNWSEQAWDKNR